MRTAVLVDAYPHAYAGAQRTDHLLAIGLPAHGWELRVVTTAEGPFTDRLRADGIEPEIVSVPDALSHYGRRITSSLPAGARGALAAPGYWRTLARTFTALGAEVVHAVGHRGAALAGPAARLARRPWVWHVQGIQTTRFANLVGSAAAAEIAIPAMSVLTRMPGLDRFAAVTEIPNVVPDHARTPARLPVRDEPLIVTSARLHPDKGLDVLIDALPDVRAEVPATTVAVLGAAQSGHEHLLDELRARAARRGVADAITFEGHVERPDLYLGRAAVYVQPSRERTELLPLALLEAMASGLPVVATDVGGVASLVRDGETGLLVPPESPAALARALVRALCDRGLRERVGAGAHTLVGDRRYTAAGLCESFASLYERVVS